jgi:hypothetical protein
VLNDERKEILHLVSHVEAARAQRYKRSKEFWRKKEEE